MSELLTDIDSTTVALLNKSEIDMQISTAKKYPRSIKSFRNETMQMVTLNEGVAGSCIYALPRGGKTIEGPSARFAEVIASAWGNCRAGARVISDNGKFITAQGVFHDLERNVSITYEVQRRVTDKHGGRFKDDMVGVTGNAASSIALRNAILKGVPKAFWDEMYQAARSTVMGDFKTLSNRRADAIKAFAGLGISEQQVINKLCVAGIEDIGLDHLVVLRGLITAIKDGDTTPEMAFSKQENKEPPQSALKKISNDDFQEVLKNYTPLVTKGKKTVDELIAMAGSKWALTDEQKTMIVGLNDVLTAAMVESHINNAKDVDALDLAADLIAEIESEKEREALMSLYKTKKDEM